MALTRDELGDRCRVDDAQVGPLGTTTDGHPSNLAIAFHPEYDYAAYEVDGKAVIVAEALAERVGQAIGRPSGKPIARMKGEQLEGIRFRHPLYERESIGVLGDYVTLEAGTGAVHTAPGHGADDS